MNEQWLEHLPLKDIKEISPVSGGDVNEAYRVETDTDTFFLLVQRGRKESFYAAEIAGLNEFERAGITAPRVIASGEVNGDAYLVMTYLEEGAFRESTPIRATRSSITQSATRRRQIWLLITL